MPAPIIDVDQHLFETRTTWIDHIDPRFRDDALVITDDAQGWPWITWRGAQLGPVEVQHPGHPEEVGENRLRMVHGERAPGSYEEMLPASYASPEARLGRARPVRTGGDGPLPQLRPDVGAVAQLGPRGPIGQPARLQPLGGRGHRGGKGPPLRRGPSQPGGHRVGGGRDRPTGVRGRAPGHGGPGPGQREVPLAAGPGPRVGGVLRTRRRPGLPRGELREPAPPRLVRR